jgi:hypothetical protein
VAGDGRKRADSVLVTALAGGATVADAAKRAQVGERTVYRRLADAEFQREVTQARSAMVAQSSGRLAALSLAAATTLGLLLKADSETVRCTAARAILELGNKQRESDEFEQRIAALEERLADQQPPSTRSPWAA